MTHPFPQASWISSSTVGSPYAAASAPFLQKTFRLEKPIKAAVLHATALGLYECEINGQHVGDQVFAPGWTDYAKRVQFQTYDVAALLREGENALQAILGDGWYCGHAGWRSRQLYGDKPQFLAQLDIVFEDGSTAGISTDATWQTASGPILANDLLMGEIYDARLKPVDWRPVQLAADPGIALVPPAGPPVRRIEELRPITVTGNIYDFGQNFSGRVRITVKAPRGTTLTLRYAEVLNPNGTLYTENLRGARATDYYTCSGEGSETWEPRFTFHGFRYAEVTGFPGVEVTGIVLYSDMPVTGSFSCSNPLLNQLQHNILWGQKGNFLEVPTDCPQRDERLGWTGDAQVFIRTAAFNMDVSGFFRKWTQDLRDAQGKNGAIPAVIPNHDFLGNATGFDGDVVDGGPAWADANIICPWTIYLCYGDKEILAKHYDSMRLFMDFMASQRCKGRIRSHPEVDEWGGFGDWLALDGSGKLDGATQKDLIGTAYYAYDAEIMTQIALALGRKEEAREYEKLHGEIVAAFRNRFVTPEGLIASGTQTAYVLALHFGLIPESVRATAAEELVRDIKKRHYHLATGFVGTPYILDVLEATGYLDVAYKLLEQETFPSWLFPVKNGATTIWERWDGWTPDKGFQDKSMNSFNHYAYGAVGAWMYRSVAGLDLDPQEPGYRHIIFRPRPGGTITHAAAALKTPHGEASIRWELENGVLSVDLTVPPGTHATFSPPVGFGGGDRQLVAGKHRLTGS